MIRLNLGSGPNLFANWTNVDRVDQSSYINILAGNPPTAMEGWPDHQRKLAAHCAAGDISCHVHDLREPLPMPDDYADCVYLGQIIEHWNPIFEAPRILKECLRVLKPGAPIRITTPDLEILLNAAVNGEMSLFESEQPDYYKAALPEMKLSLILFGASGPDCTYDNYEGHFACYTQRSIKVLLETCGFVEVSFPRVSEREVFNGVVDCGLSHSLCAEAVKP